MPQEPQGRANGARPSALARVYQDEQGARLRLTGVVGDWMDGFDSDGVADLIDPLSGPLVVEINSPGGAVFEGLAIYNMLAEYSGSVEVRITGLAASMASVIAMSGARVVMYPGTMMMIHNPWNIVMGDANDMRKNADMLDKVREASLPIYAAKSGQDRETLIAMMDEETWLTAEEAVEWGFADELVEPTSGADPEAAIAKLDLSILQCTNIPDSVAQAVARSRIAGSARNAWAAKPAESVSNHEDSEMPEPTKTPADNAAEQKTPDQIRQEAVQAERERVAGIQRNCRIAQMGEDFTNQLIEQGVSLDTAKDRIFAAMQERQAEVEINNHTRAVPGEDAREKFARGAADAILMRAGHQQNDSQNEFRSYNLRELARHSLESQGVSTGNMGVMDMVGMAFTHSTSDFPAILADVLNKEMLRGWDEAPETFSQWTRRGTLTDFKPAKRAGLNLAPGLLEVPEGAEYKYGTVGDRGEDIMLATYGRIVSLTRQAIVNDDMDAFTRVPASMGRAARRTIGNLVYAVLTTNPNMSDGTPLFDATHNNLAGSGAAPSTATFDAARTAMATQKDPASNPEGGLNIDPAFVLVPKALQGAASVVVDSETEIASNQNNSRRPNSVRNMAQVIADARLDADSTAAYYFAADPGIHDTIEVAYLDGVEAPYLEERMGWSVDGSEFKVRIDTGVKALDYRTMYKNPGQ